MNPSTEYETAMNEELTTAEQPMPLSKGVIWLLNILVTPISGAVMYYVWKADHPEAARYAKELGELKEAYAARREKAPA